MLWTPALNIPSIGRRSSNAAIEFLKPQKIVMLFRLDEGSSPALGIATSKLVDRFFSFLGLRVSLSYFLSLRNTR